MRISQPKNTGPHLEDPVATLSVCDVDSDVFSNVRQLILSGATSPIGSCELNFLLSDASKVTCVHPWGRIGWLAWRWWECIPAMQWRPRLSWRTTSGQTLWGCSASQSCLTNRNSPSSQMNLPPACLRFELLFSSVSFCFPLQSICRMLTTNTCRLSGLVLVLVLMNIHYVNVINNYWVINLWNLNFSSNYGKSPALEIKLRSAQIAGESTQILKKNSGGGPRTPHPVREGLTSRTVPPSNAFSVTSSTLPIHFQFLHSWSPPLLKTYTIDQPLRWLWNQLTSSLSATLRHNERSSIYDGGSGSNVVPSTQPQGRSTHPRRPGFDHRPLWPRSLSLGPFSIL